MRWRRSILSFILLLLGIDQFGTPLSGFPPAPHHLFYGVVRDELGNPLPTGAEVMLETAAGQLFRDWTVDGIGKGINYQLAVPMDSGSTVDLFQPSALLPSVAFRIKVRVNNVVYLPIEMKGEFKQLGQAGGKTRVDLTLGEDSDNDGLPDAWERLIDADISKVNPGDDADGDKLNNLNEYLAGTYAHDSGYGLELKIKRFEDGNPVLEFLGVSGRTYAIRGSGDLKQWSGVKFRVVTNDPEEPLRELLRLANTKRYEVKVEMSEAESQLSYFTLLVN